MKYENWLFGKDGALFRAAALGNAALLEELIRDGANVNILSRNGFTPIHRAAQNGHTQVVKILLAHGAQTDPRTNDKMKPIDLARQNGGPQVVSRGRQGGATRPRVETRVVNFVDIQVGAV